MVVQKETIEGFRLSPQQERLWLIQQAAQDRAFRAQCVVQLEGPLQLDALETALEMVVDRNEILRTIFPTLPGMTIPVQVIRSGGMRFQGTHDLQSLNQEEQRDYVEMLIAEGGQVSWNFEEGPLFCACAIRLDEEKHVLIINLPALCADAAGLKSLVHEISLCYAAAAQGDDLPDKPMQYADLSEWQTQVLESEETETGREYWRNRRTSESLSLKLPFEEPQPETESFILEAVALTIAPEKTAAIDTLCHKYDVGASDFFLACWQILLARFTTQSKLVLGVAYHGRKYKEVEQSTGLLAKYLPIRCDTEPSVSFAEFLRQTAEASSENYKWQEYFSWDHIFQTGRNDPQPAYFSGCFEFDSFPSQIRAAGVSFKRSKVYCCFDRFDLKLSCARNPDSITMELRYDPGHFGAQTVRLLSRQYYTLLSSAIANPDLAAGKLDIIDDVERRKLLVEFNKTATEYPGRKCLHQLFEEQAERTPDSIAVATKNQQLSYSELNARANKLAHHLRSLGVGAEAFVAICLERSVDMLVALLGTLKAGGAYVPLDPSHPRARLAFMLEDIQSAVLLTHKCLLERLPTELPKTICLDSEWLDIARNSENNPINLTDAGNLAYMIYTSGSTGTPKGAMIEHRALVNYLTWSVRAYDVAAGSGAVVHSPLTFDLTVTGLYGPLLTGRKVRLINEESGIDGLADALREEDGFSLVKITPAHLEVLNQQLAGEDVARMTKAFVIGGEILMAEVIRPWQERAPDTTIVNEYGPTETVVGCSVYVLDRRTRWDGAIPIGTPIANTRLYIVDEEMQPTATGAAGELYTGGDGLARGYFHRPDLTAEKFVPDPFGPKPGKRLYRTGDIARHRHDSNLECLGRVDTQVKISGYRIELGEIETALMKRDDVREVVVVARDGDLGEKRLVAYVVMKEGKEVNGVEIRRHLREQLPDYMVPWKYVGVEQMPLTSNGKVDRAKLAGEEDRWKKHEQEQEYEAARTAVEEVLVGIWQQVLRADRIGIHDNFFQAGGHSLMATQVISRIRDVFRIEIPVRRLFETPTIAGLSGDIEAAIKAGYDIHTSPIEPVPRSADLPLSFAQQRLWFIDQIEPGASTYNIPCAIRITGHLSLPALQRTFSQIVYRHEVLRTTFPKVDGRAVQFIKEARPVTLPLIDLSELLEATGERISSRLAAEEAARPFDLTTGPLLRITLLKLDQKEHILLFTMHHIIADGWSIGILIRELATLYEAYSTGQPSMLPELPIQYADFAVWQRQWLKGDVLEEQLSYWKQQLAGAPEIMELPLDRARPAAQSYRGATATTALPKTLVDLVKALSQREGVTHFMVLLAAFQTLLYRYSGQEDVVVGTGVANRNRLETEGLVGFFVNMLALRTKLDRKLTFHELLSIVREVSLGAYAHQDLPFEKLVDELRFERKLSHSPLFQVVFFLQNAPMPLLEVAGLSLAPMEIDEEKTHFDLLMSIEDRDQGMLVSLQYSGDLFDEITIDEMLNHYRIVLEEVVENPNWRLIDIPLVRRESSSMVEAPFDKDDQVFKFPVTV